MTDAHQPENPSQDPAPEGIGGWLILPIVGLVLTIVFTGVNIAAAWSAENLQAYAAFFSGRPDAEIRPYVYLWWGSMILAALLVCFAMVCLARIFQRGRHVPALMVAYYVFVLVVAAYEFAGTQILRIPLDDDAAVLDALRSAALAIIGASIWIPYFLWSKRVKNTFVH